MRGKQLNVENPMSHFREWELSRFQPLVPGMDVLVKSFVCKHLPKICFEMYGDDGADGKLIAMKRRRTLRDADPKRQERKRLKKINELKAKMAEIQKKKEEEKAAKLGEEGDNGDDVQMEEANEGEADGDPSLGKRKRSDSGASGDMLDADEEPKAKAVKVEDETETGEGGAGDDDGDNFDEADLLESALDMIEVGGERKTREEAEADRRKLLAGELLVEGEDDDASDDEGMAYTGDGARQTFHVKPKKAAGDGEKKATAYKDIRALPMTDEEVEILQKAGYNVVGDSDEETRTIGGNMPVPFRNENNAIDEQPIQLKIKFRTKFDIVELDPAGHIIDKGDDDFKPSKTWTGRMAGFEFKLGERGQGYYRTGKKVVVPSNTAY